MNSSVDKYQQIIDKCDALIKAGQLQQVAQIMGQLNLSQVPRTKRQSLAKICRRATLISQGLRLLHPIIRQEKSLENPATSGELCEYAVLLIRNGSIQEAEALLKNVNLKEAPEGLMYLGFVGIANWDYVPAAHFLKEFLDSNSDPYTKLIAQVNLASCYVVLSQFAEASHLLEECIELARQAGANRLIGNCHELFGQVHFWQNNFAGARLSLLKASEIFGNAQSYDQLLILKTQSIMNALEANSLEPLQSFRKNALQRQHWESVREADLFTLKVQFQQQKLDHLICGTPLSHYRERIQTLIGHKPSSSYILGDPSSKCLDLQTGRSETNAELLPGRKMHQVIAALTKDFYVPRNIGHLFSDLYPGEFFNISSSRFRVRQLIVRARMWLKESNIPASIDHNNGTYRFQIHGRFGIRIPLETAPIDILDVRWFELKTAFTSRKFSAEEACSHLRIPRTTLRRLIDWAMSNGLLQKTGVGRSTCYQIVDLKGSGLKQVA